MSIRFDKIYFEPNRELKGIEELAANIKEIGLINPISLKKTGKPGFEYEVIAGRRRFAALLLLERKELTPGEYTVYTGDNAGMVTFCENHQRENLTIAEEVAELEALRKASPDVSIPEIARQLGRTPAYVALRLNLTNLTKRWRRELENPERTVPLAVLEILARETPEVQDTINVYSGESAGKLQNRLAEMHCDLKTAIFDTAGCANCPKQSGASSLLFPELEGKARCLDRKCFEDKKCKQVLVNLEEAKAANPELKLFILDNDAYSYKIPASLGKYKDALLCSWHYNVGKKGGEKAFFIWGARAGKCVSIELTTSGMEEVKSREKAAAKAAAPPEKKEKTLADREAELKAKQIRHALDAYAEKFKSKDIATELAAANSRNDEQFLRNMLVLDLTFGREYAFAGLNCAAGKMQEAQTHLSLKVPELALVFFDKVRKQIIQQLKMEAKLPLCAVDDRTALELERLTLIDFKPFMKAAEAAIPPNKALLAARLEAKNKKEKAKNDP